MSHVFLRKVTKIIPLLAALTGGALDLHAMKTGQGDVSPNRNIGAISEKAVFKKRMGFQAFLAQSGKSMARNLVQMVARAHHSDRKLAKLPEKKGSFVHNGILRGVAKLGNLPDFYHASMPGFADCPVSRAVSEGATVTEICYAGAPPSPDKAILRMMWQSAEPEVCPMGSLGEDMRRLRRILDLFRPALLVGGARQALVGPGVSQFPPDAGASGIHFAMDLASAGAPLTHGRLGAHIALRSNRSRDNWS